jgi:hypothetical protein
LLGVRPERVDSKRLDVVGPFLPEVGRLRVADAAGAEDNPDVTFMIACVDDRSGPIVVGRPDRLTVEANVVGDDGVGFQVVDEQEGVVVALDRKGRRPVAEDLDLAGRVRLDPEGGALGPRVAQEGAKDEFRSVLRRCRYALDPPVARFDEGETRKGEQARCDSAE